MNKTIKKLQSIKDNLTTECVTDTIFIKNMK